MLNPWKALILIALSTLPMSAGHPAPDVIPEGEKILRNEIRIDLGSLAGDHVWLYEDFGRRKRMLEDQVPLRGYRAVRILRYPARLVGRVETMDDGKQVTEESLDGQEPTATSAWIRTSTTVPETDPAARQRITYGVNAIEDKEIIVKESAREQFDAEGKLLTTEEREEIQVARQSRLLWIALAGLLGLVILGLLRRRRAQAGVT